MKLEPYRKTFEDDFHSHSRHTRNINQRKKRAPLRPVGLLLLEGGVQLAAFSTASMLGGFTYALTRDHLANHRVKVELKKRTNNCRENSYGCFLYPDGFGKCFTNCGPRQGSSDWCFTEPKISNQTTSTTENAQKIVEINNSTATVQNKNDAQNGESKFDAIKKYGCRNKLDCDPCAICISGCFFET